MAAGRVGLLLALMVGLVGCDSTTEPESGRSESELRFVTFAPDLAAMVETAGSVWAVKGEDRRLSLHYLAGSSGQGSDEFMRFDIPGDALLRRPDGTPFQVGDSILITVELPADGRLLFRFQPSGLRFDPERPARLRVDYRRLNGDLDGDGKRTAADDRLERDMRIWKQERPGERWFPIGTVKDLDERELRGTITDFTGFAIAA
jgi:hypothetical protein